MLVFADGRLMAVLVRISDESEVAPGDWYLEAGFGTGLLAQAANMPLCAVGAVDALRPDRWQETLTALTELRHETDMIAVRIGPEVRQAIVGAPH